MYIIIPLSTLAEIKFTSETLKDIKGSQITYMKYTNICLMHFQFVWY